MVWAVGLGLGVLGLGVLGLGVLGVVLVGLGVLCSFEGPYELSSLEYPYSYDEPDSSDIDPYEAGSYEESDEGSSFD